jgi:hypothetical protein
MERNEHHQFETWKEWATANDVTLYYLQKAIDENKVVMERNCEVMNSNKKDFDDLVNKFIEFRTKVYTIIAIVVGLILALIGVLQFTVN